MTKDLEDAYEAILRAGRYMDDHEIIQLRLLLYIATSLEEIKDGLAGLRGLQISGSGRQPNPGETSYVFQVMGEGGRTERTDSRNKS